MCNRKMRHEIIQCLVNMDREPVGAMLACISSVLVAIGGVCVLYMSVAAQRNIEGDAAHRLILDEVRQCALNVCELAGTTGSRICLHTSEERRPDD